MSETRVRGRPEGETAKERVAHWLAERPFEELVWVGKNYSLAQLKADVRAVNPPHTDWPSKEPK